MRGDSIGDPQGDGTPFGRPHYSSPGKSRRSEGFRRPARLAFRATASSPICRHGSAEPRKDPPMRSKLIAAGIVLCLALAVAGWFARKPLLARYYVRQLSAAVDHDIDYDGLVSVSEAALPRILDL